MTKAQYLEALEARIGALPKEERESALRFYAEYFDDAGVENQQQVIEQLGTPERVAQQLLGDAAMPKAPRERRRIGVWTWVLIVFASPILLGLAAGALGLLIGALAAVFCVLLALVIVALSPLIVCATLVLTGTFCLLAGLLVTLQSFPTMMLYAGSGLVLLVLGLWMFHPCIALLQRSLRVIFRFSGWLVRMMKALRAHV